MMVVAEEVGVEGVTVVVSEEEVETEEEEAVVVVVSLHDTAVNMVL